MVENKTTIVRNCLVILLLLSSVFIPLFATSSEISWFHEDDEVHYSRYQWNREEGGAWTILEGSSGILLKEASYEDVFFLQSSYDGVHWSKSAILSVAEHRPHQSQFTSSQDILHVFHLEAEDAEALRFRFPNEAWISLPSAKANLPAKINPWLGEKLEVQYQKNGEWGRSTYLKTPVKRSPWLSFGTSQYVWSNESVYSTSLFGDFRMKKPTGFCYGLSSSFTFSIRSYSEMPKDYRSGDLLLLFGGEFHGVGLSALGGVTLSDIHGGDLQPSGGVELSYSIPFGPDAELGLGTRFLTLPEVYVWTPLIVRYAFRLGGRP